MINSNILDSLKSNLQDPSYSMIITDFIQTEHCNKDELQIVIDQINPNLFDIIANQNNIINIYQDIITENNIDLPDLDRLESNTVTSKTLKIESIIDYETTSSMFISRLTGQVINESEKQAPSTTITGDIYYNKIHITKPDSPQYLNFSKFNIKKKSIAINIPEIIQDIIVKLNHENIIVEYENETIEIEFDEYRCSNILNKQININLENICDNLFDKYNVDEEINENNTLINQYKNNKIDDTSVELTEEEQSINEELDQQITELEELNEYLNGKNNIIKEALNQLNFGSQDVFQLDISYNKKPDLTEQHIESITTKLSTQIDIDFEYKYETLPAVIITVDERKKAYSSYTLEFKQKGGKYIGVIVYLKNLKRNNQENDINITIIGD